NRSDGWRRGRQHPQPTKSEPNPAGGRHLSESREKIFIDRVALAMDPFFFRHGSLEAGTLLSHIGQLAKGVGELHATRIKLKAFCDRIAVRFGSCERSQWQRVLIQDGGATDAEPRIDPFGHDAAEDIAPGV